MTNFIDLHAHSTASDGTLTPTQIVDLALEKGLRAVALTDHDTLSGVDEALNAARDTSLLLIPGIEFSTTYGEIEVHMLGLSVNHRYPSFVEAVRHYQELRNQRNLKMMEKMRAHGIDIDSEKMAAEFPDKSGVWTRAHFGRYLLNHGYVSERQEAFDRYLADGACCFVKRPEISPFTVIEQIHEAGGIAVLAHPLLYKLSAEELDLLVSRCADAGLDGLEAMYSRNKEGDEEAMRCLADAYHLKISGGSDFHGRNKPDIDLGSGAHNLEIPWEVWENLRG